MMYAYMLASMLHAVSQHVLHVLNVPLRNTQQEIGTSVNRSVAHMYIHALLGISAHEASANLYATHATRSQD